MFFKILFLILFTSLHVVHADSKGLYLCNNVWTTEACDSPDAVLPYSESTQSESDSAEKQRKNEIEKILHPIRIKSSELGHTYHARYDISYIEHLCNDQDTPISDCRNAAINEHEKILNYELKLRDQELRKTELENEHKTRDTDVTIHQNYPPPVIGIRNGQHIHPRLGPRRRPPQSHPHRSDIPHTQQIPRANPGQSLSIPPIQHRGNR
jgi:hypothetical protein